MKDLYKKISGWFVGLGIDKYLHFNVCLILCGLIAKLLPFEVWINILIAFGVGIVIGVAKEVYDYFDYGKFDIKDLYADILGTIVGILIGF